MTKKNSLFIDYKRKIYDDIFKKYDYINRYLSNIYVVGYKQLN